MLAHQTSIIMSGCVMIVAPIKLKGFLGVYMEFPLKIIAMASEHFPGEYRTLRSIQLFRIGLSTLNMVQSWQSYVSLIARGNTTKRIM